MAAPRLRLPAARSSARRSRICQVRQRHQVDFLSPVALTDAGVLRMNMKRGAGGVEPFCRTPRQLYGPGIFHWLESRYARSRSYLAICSCFIDVTAFRYLRIDFSRVVFRNWTPALARRRYCGRAGRLELISLLSASVRAGLAASADRTDTVANVWKEVIAGHDALRRIGAEPERALNRLCNCLRFRGQEFRRQP